MQKYDVVGLYGWPEKLRANDFVDKFEKLSGLLKLPIGFFEFSKAAPGTTIAPDAGDAREVLREQSDFSAVGAYAADERVEELGFKPFEFTVEIEDNPDEYVTQELCVGVEHAALEASQLSLLDLCKEAVDSLTPSYGFGTLIRTEMSPVYFVNGAGVIYDRRANIQSMKFQHGRTICLVDKFRDVFEVNYFSDRHGRTLIDGITLVDWLAAQGHNVGKIAPNLWQLRPRAGSIASLREALTQAGILI